MIRIFKNNFFRNLTLKRYFCNILDYKDMFYNQDTNFKEKIFIFNETLDKINFNINDIKWVDCENLINFYNELISCDYQLKKNKDINNLYNIILYFFENTKDFDQFVNCLILSNNIFQDKKELWDLVSTKYINFTGYKNLEKNILKYLKMVNIINDNIENTYDIVIYYKKAYDFFRKNYENMSNIDLLEIYSEILHYDENNVLLAEMIFYFYSNIKKLNEFELWKFLKLLNNYIDFENELNPELFENKVLELVKNIKNKKIIVSLYFELIQFFNNINEIWYSIGNFIENNFEILDYPEKVQLLKTFSICNRGDDDFWIYILKDIEDNFEKINYSNIIEVIHCVKITNFNKYDITKFIDYIFKNNLANLSIDNIIRLVYFYKNCSNYTEDEEELIELEIKKRWPFMPKGIKVSIYNHYYEEESQKVESFHLQDCFKDLEFINN